MAVKASNQISIVDVTDAYSVILTSEAYTFVGGTSGVGSGKSCTTQVVVYQGGNQISSVAIGDITCPTGISASVSGSGGSSPTITFTTTATVSDACEATIPVTIGDVTVNKKFSFAVAMTGASGTSVSIKSTSVTYQAGSSGTTTPTGTWSTTIPATTAGQYLWTKTVVTYSNSTSTTSYSVSYTAADGDSVSVSSSVAEYQVSDSGTTTPTGTWSTAIPTVGAGQYLWTRSTVTYSDGATAVSYSVSYAGTDGADAITLSITSSAGTVFKNSSGSTTLTAHVYKAGTELTITSAGVCGSEGSIKWYKSTDTDTVLATAKEFEVKAEDVDNVAAYTCQLEG